MDRERLAVGDSTKLEIIFSTKQYSNRVVKQPKIKTNEGPPDKRVRIVATVVRRPDSTYPVILRPYKLDLSQIGNTVRDEIKFTIENVSESDLDLSLVASKDEYFEISLPDKVSAGKSAEGVLKLTKEGIDEEFEKSFTIAVSDETGSRFTVPVKRAIRTPASQQPGAAPGNLGHRGNGK